MVVRKPPYQNWWLDFQGTCMVEFCPQISTISMAPMGPLKCCRFLVSKHIISSSNINWMVHVYGINYHSSHSHDSAKNGGGISNNSNITFQMQSFSLDHERCTHLEELGKGPYDDSIRCSILSCSHMIPIWLFQMVYIYISTWTMIMGEKGYCV